MREQAILDLFIGAMLVSFIMMIGSVFLRQLMHELTSSARITLAIGGLAGLFFIGGEVFKENKLEEQRKPDDYRVKQSAKYDPATTKTRRVWVFMGWKTAIEPATG